MLKEKRKTVTALPTTNNTILDEEIYIEPIYIKATRACELFDLSRSTVNKYLQEAEEDEKYRNRISIAVAQNILLVNIRVFEEFLKSKHKKFL
ncbi:helix-turn-helix domain-containing protein [Mammaliicoccus fleurettii]|uniref:helix-turn-helix domain-containing protein n=1 Tax=Mammaliicoccus fleurettii TaxID=150056 RepID=UPI001AAC77B2|nr:helix-turn-helix domain-containing protein [Mammaliicoccus fleurettii]MBO3062772.1 helix-turn-helix domain-containing protein [Mammaliicoccus fleurettii]MEB7723435.1 helix-turn-helix domain-containing protein [Mammaliicoccus fleurettii]